MKKSTLSLSKKKRAAACREPGVETQRHQKHPTEWRGERKSAHVTVQMYSTDKLDARQVAE